MKLIVAGATGFVGSEVVRQALGSTRITSIIALARKPVKVEDGVNVSKLKYVAIHDYAEYPEDVKKELAGADACIWTVAITPLRSKRYAWEEVKRVCQYSTMAGMKALQEAGPNKPFRFIYMSGFGVKRNETQKPGWMGEYIWMRGETESQVLAFAAEHGFEATVAKPGLIHSDKMVASFVMSLTARFVDITVITVQQIAAALLQQSLNGIEKDPLENADLVRIGKAALEEQKK